MIFYNTEVIFEEQLNLRRILLSYPINENILLIISKNGVKRWHIEQIIQEMASRYQLYIIDKIVSYPTQKDVIECLDMISHNEVNKIVVIGGGSYIDLAKALVSFYESYKNNNYKMTIEDITRSINNTSYKNHMKDIEIIAIPSTAGTGSEVTNWATLWDIDKKCKHSIEHNKLYPKQAIIIPELTLTLSKKITLTTGLDALAHAMEAYWARKTDELLKDISIQAIMYISKNLKKALDYPKELSYRKKLSRGAVLAGLAFSQTRTTACHSISYPLTMDYGIEHGLAVALTLEPILIINKDSTKEMNRILDVFDEFGGISKWLEYVCEGIVELKLSSFGIKEEELDKIAKKAFTKGRMDNNPVALTKEDVVNVLKSIY